jgi:Flp pilus assembly protein TadB
MDNVFVFGAGFAVGGFLVWAIIEIRNTFKKSRDLDAAAKKDKKESGEKAQKARENKRKAQAAARRSWLLGILLGAGLLFLIWLVTMVVLPMVL